MDRFDDFRPKEDSDNKDVHVDDTVKEDKWTSHRVDTFNESNTTYTQSANNPRDTFNVNYSTGSPGSAAPQPPKKNGKGPKLVIFVLVGILLLSGVIGGSVFVGYSLATHVENNLRDINGNLAEEAPVDLTGKTDIVKSQHTILSVPEIAKKVAPSVVAINTKTQVQTSFMPMTSEGAGSGFVFAETADVYYIATNNHVIEGATEANIAIHGESIPAYLQGRDPITDLAVIYVKKSEIPAAAAGYIKVAELGESADLVVGELAVAIGNPLGLGESVTAGVVSALDRKVVTDNREFTLIQTDAAINPGNSGGALVNGSGEIVGINTLKIGQSDVEGIGFAIPMDSAKPILNEIIEQGSIQRPYIGIYGRDMTDDLANMYGLPLGVFIMEAQQDGPAARAGVRKADVIIAANDETIKSMSQLKEVIGRYEIGDQISLTIIRDGKTKTINVVLEGK